MKQIILESAALMSACVMGAIVFRSLNTFYRIIFFQTMVSLVFYGASYGITEYQRLHELPRNNQWLFNVYIFVEAIMLTAAGLVFFANRKVRYLLYGGLIIFVLVFAAQVAIGGFGRFAHYAVMVEGVLVVMIYLLILHTSFLLPGFHWRSSPELWMCLGLTLYFGCNIPYIGMIHYLHAHYPDLNVLLFHFITDVLGNVRYLLLSVALLLFYRRSSLRAESAES